MKTPMWFSVGGLGYFKEDRNIAIYGAISNLLVSIIAANYLGLFGIFFGTAFSQITQWILKTKLYCKKYMNMKATEYALQVLRLAALSVVLAILTGGICHYVKCNNLYLALFLKACVCLLVPNLFNYVLFHKSEDFRYLMSIFTRWKVK